MNKSSPTITQHQNGLYSLSNLDDTTLMLIVHLVNHHAGIFTGPPPGELLKYNQYNSAAQRLSAVIRNSDQLIPF